MGKITKKEFLRNVGKLFLAWALVGCDVNEERVTNMSSKRGEYRNEYSQEINYSDEGYRIGRDVVRHPNFRFPGEAETIRFHAARVGVEPELLLAIRESENGREGLQFGIIPNDRYRRDNGYSYNGAFHNYPNDRELSKQASWSAWTVRRNTERFNSLNERERNNYSDFIDYLSRRYAPRGADNDPNNLNENWARNVRNRYNAHRGGR